MGSEGLDELPVRPEAARRIYAYRLNLTDLAERIKVGETNRAVAVRISEQVNTAGLADVLAIVMDKPAIDAAGRPFRDLDVHVALEQRGFAPLPGIGGVEWFLCSDEEVQAAYLDVYEGKQHDLARDKNFTMRAEQEQAVELTQRYFASADGGSRPRFLWNAKMRFGKTFAAYQLAKRLDAERVLVVTYKPAVEDAWEADLKTHVDFDGWQYWSSSAGSEQPVPSDKPLVTFASFQYLRHHTAGATGRADWIYEEQWDLVIVDEYHFGAWRTSTRELLAAEADHGTADLGEEGFDDPDDGELIESALPTISGKRHLYLSGTPFRAIATRDFEEDQIFNWTYPDEQRAKERFSKEHPNEESPYAALPQMQLITYRLPDTIGAVARRGERNEFDLNSFFETRGSGSNARFVREDDVQGWLTWIRGEDVEATLGTLGSDIRPFPFRNLKLLSYLNHSVWFLPSVAAVHAMKGLLSHATNIFWHEYEVLPVAGNSAGIGLAALKPVREAVGSGVDSKTITLSCGKLLTGVTVAQWSAILMLCNLSAPETYFQAAFRVQSSWAVRNPNGDDPNELQVRKPACLVVDFAPNRALRQVADYGARLGTGDDPEDDVRELARYLPVLAFEGASLRHLDPGEIFDQVLQDSPVDVRRMDSARFINPSRHAFETLSEQTQRAFDSLPGANNGTNREADETAVNDTPEIEGVGSGRTAEGGPDDPGPDPEPEIDPADAEKTLTEQLRFIVKRLPAFMYISDARERSLREVLDTAEALLFKQVVGVSPAEFRELMLTGLLDESAMKLAVAQFRRAEDESLVYTGLVPAAAGDVT